MIKTLLVYSLLVPILLSTYSCIERRDKVDERLELKKKSLQTKVGEKFVVRNIIDSSGRLVQLNFTQSEITIIDFWFNECPPCLEEMRQFETLLKGNEKKVNVISVSVNRYGLWKSILQKPVGKFFFLTNNVNNWKHYNLQSSENERLKNTVPMDSQEQLKRDLNITFYPAYFIVDRSGVILSRPISAVDYIKAL